MRRHGGGGWLNTEGRVLRQTGVVVRQCSLRSGFEVFDDVFVSGAGGAIGTLTLFLPYLYNFARSLILAPLKKPFESFASVRRVLSAAGGLAGVYEV